MTINRIPLATYRLQLNSQFRFADAAEIAPYLRQLGISDIYSSPIFTARKGSTHGYDVVDAKEINRELGGEADFDRLTKILQAQQLGFLLDIVPNHMAASPENSWWMNVLEYGSDSPYAHYFDVVWQPILSYGSVRNRLLLPVLGRPYGEVLEGQELKLDFDEGSFFFTYYERRIPVSPRTYALILQAVLERTESNDNEWSRQLATLASEEFWREVSSSAIPERAQELKRQLAALHANEPEFRSALAYAIRIVNGDPGTPASFDQLDRLIEAQPYRLAYWRMAAEEINYRRFFDVTDLVGVRIEDPEVFENRHARLFELAREGKVTGVRIDHIDGLFDPLSYLRRLSSRLSPAEETRFYTVVEKILARGEELPEAWPVHGTTGYDFLNILNDVFIDESNLPRLSEIYSSFAGVGADAELLGYESKKKVINALFAGEIRALAAMLGRIALTDRNARDFAFVELLHALTEITACLSVYRTYIRDFHVSDVDAHYINEAIAEAKQRGGEGVDHRVLDFVGRVLRLEIPRYVDERRDWLDFVQRWQQFTGRSMAKGVEDTTFYIYNRLISMNEVGGEPGASRNDVVDDFHQWNDRQRRAWPQTLNTTSTHDTKRSEDVRARINVLSEMPDAWEAKLRRWGRANHALKRQTGNVLPPDRNEEIFIYQTLLGAWPLSDDQPESLVERLGPVIEKSLREAKVNTSWLDTRSDYEQAVIAFIKGLLDSSRSDFLQDFKPFAETIAFYGFLNAIAQQLLKITAPGIPDFYQGAETWDFSLVDPDNRRPVDFTLREKMLRDIKRDDISLSELLSKWHDGRVKLFTIERALRVRDQFREAFERGDYRPLYATGSAAKHVCAFMRSLGSTQLITVVPRLVATLTAPGELPLGAATWSGARLLLPSDSSPMWKNAFTGERVEAFPLAAGEYALPLEGVLKSYPLALLIASEERE